MSDLFTSVYDDLARVTSQLDQVQAQIDETRSMYSNDQHAQLELDRRQSEVNASRKRVRLMKDIADMIYDK